jgi:adenine-specific DNA-methyltransferase
MPSPAFTKLRSRLAELFQLDAAAELDFGIYRILNARRGEIARFLDSLEAQVEGILGQAGVDAGAPVRAELEKVEAGLRAGGIDEAMIAAAPKVRELREKLAGLGGAGQETGALRDEIFSLLTTFFSRYYKDGDFLSLRRYKADTYAIPYEGEEVKLHWANADQFYIKSAENFRDYTFRLGSPPTGDVPDTRPRVTFKLIEADTEKDNNKPVAGKERRFIYTGEAHANGSHLTLHFQHRALKPEEGGGGDDGETEADPPKKKGKKVNQAALNDRAIAAILPQYAKGPFLQLAALLPTKANPSRSVLDKHLADYTARNTFDYFIHKDLGGFLRRELDFFIKNEVVHLDDLDDAPEPAWATLRARLKALRAIAHKVIRFLAQIEDFQKKLWLKKKFVTGCDYVVTLDLLPEELYPDISACEAQREEWVRLFAIDEIKGDLGRTGYSVPLTVEFLKENRFLPVDTRLMPSAMGKREFARSDESISALLLQSDNFQGLRHLLPRLAGRVKMTYIDPPYNTGGDGFLYIDAYKHSSWLSMIHQRLTIAQRLTSLDGAIYSSIDAEERSQLEAALNLSYGNVNRVEEIIWAQNTTKNQSPTFSTNHEYVEVYAKDLGFVKKDFTMFRESKPGYNEVTECISEMNREFPSTSVVEAALRKLFKEHKMEMRRENVPDEDDPWRGIYNYNNAEYRDAAGGYVSECDAGSKNATLWIWREVDASMPQVKEDSQKEEFRDPESPTFRFYKPKHPTTGKCCPAPKRGWAWPFEPHGRQQTSFQELSADHRIAWGSDETKIPQRKSFLHEVETNVPKSVISDYTDGEKELTDLFGKMRSFSGPKPSTLIQRFVRQASNANSWVLDFFAGSGTTGHAVINLNREDGGNRRYILVEMGEHFETVLVPRLKKVIYAKDWKDGKPVSRDTGVSHCFKVLRLESYEDTLNNLRLRRTPEQEAALDQLDLTAAEAAEDYRLGYMLDLESAGSASLLNVGAFSDPWNYTLDVATGTAGETRPVAVDLVETFNWLLGLTVLGMARSGGVLWVEGTNPEGEKVLVLWRKTVGDGAVDAVALNHWCRKMKVSVLDGEYGLIYVNGDHHLENLRREDQTWKVRLIDEEFPRLMFAGQP